MRDTVSAETIPISPAPTMITFMIDTTKPTADKMIARYLPDHPLPKRSFDRYYGTDE